MQASTMMAEARAGSYEAVCSDSSQRPARPTSIFRTVSYDGRKPGDGLVGWHHSNADQSVLQGTDGDFEEVALREDDCLTPQADDGCCSQASRSFLSPYSWPSGSPADQDTSLTPVNEYMDLLLRGPANLPAAPNFDPDRATADTTYRESGGPRRGHQSHRNICCYSVSESCRLRGGKVFSDSDSEVEADADDEIQAAMGSRSSSGTCKDNLRKTSSLYSSTESSVFSPQQSNGRCQKGSTESLDGPLKAGTRSGTCDRPRKSFRGDSFDSVDLKEDPLTSFHDDGPGANPAPPPSLASCSSHKAPSLVDELLNEIYARFGSGNNLDSQDHTGDSASYYDYWTGGSSSNTFRRTQVADGGRGGQSSTRAAYQGRQTNGSQSGSQDSDCFTEYSTTSDRVPAQVGRGFGGGSSWSWLSNNRAQPFEDNKARIKCRQLRSREKGLSELKQDVRKLETDIQYTMSQLARQVKRRDRFRHRRERQCNFITAILQASSEKRSQDTRIRFSLEPSGGDPGYAQWKDGMKMVARLPEGIPVDFRRKLWLTLADKHLANREVDWKKAEKFCFNEWSNPDDNELGLQIVRDLHRTGCSLFSGKDALANQLMLKRVLLAYARWNKTIGYCQGFNMLAAIILEVMEKSEPDSLKVMIYMIEGILPECYFTNNLRGLSVDMVVFRDLLKMRLPRLSQHLENLQNNSREGTSVTSYEPPLTNVFTMQWFLTLFSTCLPKETVLRVWDLILLDGNEVLQRTALAIWKTLEERIISIDTADEFYCLMGQLSQELLEYQPEDASKLIKLLVEIAPFPFTEVAELRERYTYNITPWSQGIAVAKKGLKILYSDDEDYLDDDEEKIAVAATFGMTAVFRSPSRSSRFLHSPNPKGGPGKLAGGGTSPTSIPGARGSPAGAKAFGAAGQKPPAGAAAAAANMTGPSQSNFDKERLSVDISALQKQYSKLRQRQKQAQVILTSAMAKPALPSNGEPGARPSRSSSSICTLTSEQQASVKTYGTAVTPTPSINHLLLGKKPLVNAKPRRAPHPGAIPEARTRSISGESKTIRSSCDTQRQKNKNIKPSTPVSGQGQPDKEPKEACESSSSSDDDAIKVHTQNTCPQPKAVSMDEIRRLEERRNSRVVRRISQEDGSSVAVNHDLSDEWGVDPQRPMQANINNSLSSDVDDEDGRDDQSFASSSTEVGKSSAKTSCSDIRDGHKWLSSSPEKKLSSELDLRLRDSHRRRPLHREMPEAKSDSEIFKSTTASASTTNGFKHQSHSFAGAAEMTANAAFMEELMKDFDKPPIFRIEHSESDDDDDDRKSDVMGAGLDTSPVHGDALPSKAFRSSANKVYKGGVRRTSKIEVSQIIKENSEILERILRKKVADASNAMVPSAEIQAEQSYDDSSICSNLGELASSTMMVAVNPSGSSSEHVVISPRRRRTSPPSPQNPPTGLVQEMTKVSSGQPAITLSRLHVEYGVGQGSLLLPSPTEVSKPITFNPFPNNLRMTQRKQNEVGRKLGLYPPSKSK